MLIINQDRNKVLTMTNSSVFYMVPVMCKDIDMGYNIFIDWDLLGTFWCKSEALYEMGLIFSSKSKIYLVNDYKNF